MKRNWRIIGLSLLLGLFIASSANAVVLNFDDLTPGTDLKGTYYQGVYFTAPHAASIFVYADNQEGLGCSSLHNSISTTQSEIYMGGIKVVFPVPVSYVKVTAGDAGADEDSFALFVYDAADNLLNSASAGIFGGNALNYTNEYYVDEASLELTANNIAWAWMIPTSPSGLGLSFDDLTYIPVPLPGTLLLVSSGLLTLAGWRGKFLT
jgi:hypothetical protein